jgi:hypothetical protein
MRVWLVGTVHEEQGLARVSGLQSILERIRPEVIFLEIPPAAWDAYLNGIRSNLESTAARRYREGHNAALVCGRDGGKTKSRGGLSPPRGP